MNETTILLLGFCSFLGFVFLFLFMLPEPKIGYEKAHDHCQDKPENGVAAHQHCDGKSQKSWYGQSCPEENVCMCRFFISGEHQSAGKPRIRLGRDKPADDTERLGDFIRAQNRAPGLDLAFFVGAARLSCDLVQKRTLRRGAGQHKSKQKYKPQKSAKAEQQYRRFVHKSDRHVTARSSNQNTN